MDSTNLLVLGTTLASTGAGLWLVAWALAHVTKSEKAVNTKSAPLAPIPVAEEPKSDSAVLIVTEGGKVAYIDSQARNMLNLNTTDLPSLDYILEHTHPEEELLKLCTAPGQATLTVGSTPVTAVSHFVPYMGTTAALITLQPLEHLKEEQTDFGTTIQTLNLFASLTQSVNKELDIEKVILAFARAINRVIQSDAIRISLLDEKGLIHPFVFHGPLGKVHKVTTIPPHPPTSGLAKHVLTTKKPLLIPDVRNLPEKFKNSPPHQPRGTYLGVPIIVGEEVIGLLEVGNAEEDAFSQIQLEFLTLLANMAGASVRNAHLFTETQKRLRELQSLADLAAAVSGSKELHTLVQKILESVRPLTKAEILGLILYDEAHRDLVAQKPFLGLPESIIANYRGHVASGSKAEAIIQNREPIVVEANAPEDERIKALGFSNFYLAASIDATVLYPLHSGRQFLGYLQIANTPERPPFTEEERKVVALAASQVAPLLENAVLFQQARERARRAEALRRVASLAASSASTDELLKFSVLELAHLLNVKKAAVRLLDEDSNRLVPHLPSLVGIPKELAKKLGESSAQYADFASTVSHSGKALISKNAQTDENLPQVYRELLQNFPEVKSVLIVPLRTEQRILGELVFLSEQEGRFDENDLKLVSATASQIALSLERQRLLSESDISLRRRVEELSTLAHLSRELGLLSSLNEVLRYSHKQMLALTNSTCGAIFLLRKQQGNYKIKHLVADEGCQRALSPLDKETLERGEPLAVEDYSTDVLQPPHEGVRSSLSLPLKYQDKTLGVVHLHSNKARHFTTKSIHLAHLVAQHVAVAIGNAQRQQSLLEENAALQSKAHALTLLRNFLHSEQPLSNAKGAISKLVSALHQITPFDAIWVGEYNPSKGTISAITSVGFHPSEPLPWDSLSLLLEDEFNRAGVYFIPAEKRPPTPSNLNLPQPKNPIISQGEENSWRQDDLLLVPIRASNGQVIGLIYFNSPRNGSRPSATELEIIRLFAAQIAWLMEAHQTAQALIKRQEALEKQIEQTDEALRTAQKDTPRWMRKDLQQTIDRYRLAQRANRLHKGLNIAALVNQQPSRSAVLDALGTQLIEQFGFNYLLIAAPAAGTKEGLHLEQAFGDLPTDLKIEILLGQRNPLSEVVRKGEVIIESDIQRNNKWANSPLLQRLEIKGFIAFPIYTEQAGEGATSQKIISHVVMAGSCTPLLEFSEDESAIFQLISRQVGITLDNLTMLARTERRLREAALLLEFSSQLGVLDPERILNTLLHSTLGVLQNVHAGFVALWQPEKEILKPVVATGYARSDEIKNIVLPKESLPANVMFEGRSRIIDELDFAAAYPFDADNLLRYRTATAERLPVSSMMVPIRSGENSLGVIVLDNFNTASAFTAEDEKLVLSLTQQTALALENARLLNTAERRASQLQALAKVSTNITAHILSYEEVAKSLLDQLAQVLPYDRGTLWLLEGNRLTVHDARGFENAQEIIGISTNVEDSALFQEMLRNKRPLVVNDVTKDPRFPKAQPIPYRSWLGIPLVLKEKVLGVMALEKDKAHFFTADWVETAETFAAQAAAALENARLHEETLRRTNELDERTRRLALVYQVTSNLATSLDPQYIARYTAERLHEALGKGKVITLLWHENKPTIVAQFPESAKTENAPEIPAEAPLWEHLRESGGIYRAKNALDDEELAPLHPLIAAHKAKSATLVPMIAGQSLMGVMVLLTGEEEEVDADELELAKTLANQAAVALQNARLYEETRRFSEELERRVEERTAELQREHHRSQTLLKIIGELAASLDLDQVLNRTLALLNESLSADHSSILLARPGEKTLFLRAAYGKSGRLPLGGRPTNISATDSLAGWVITHRQPILIGDLQADPRWRRRLEGEELQHRSAICVPLIFGEEVLGALMIFHEEPDRFTEYHLDLAMATAKQMAITINQSEIFRLVNEQAEHLGRMARAQEIEARRAKAILEAIADGVVVTDKRNKITLFNPSASRILGIPAEKAIGQPLSHFIGFFGAAGRQWMETIHMWSENPEMSAEGITYEEQIEMEDGRVISVHLAPVFSRSEFLGTVSVFRDITHQVEVDRLKSEFVATVSHELRTPMTAIKGYVDILLMGAAGPLTEQQRQFLNTVKSNTERLNLLVSDLLDISRIEAGHISLIKEEIDLGKLIQEVVAEVKRIAKDENRPMNFEVEIAPDLPHIYADRERIRQVVENLVENAYRYTPEGGKITVRAYPLNEGEIQVDVIDTGIGIPPEEQERVFERFYRGENPLVMASAGTGLGLSIVKTLVEMHNGEIWLSSEGIPGKGSTFSFKLPVKGENNNETQHHAPPSEE